MFEQPKAFLRYFMNAKLGYLWKACAEIVTV